MKKISIALAADHAGYHMKDLIKTFLSKEGFEVKDFGANSSEDVDYPDYIHSIALAINNKEFDLGFIFCGSGNGVNMTANKYQQVRSALCWNAEIAQLAKAHNNANICAIPARFISANETIAIVKEFLKTEFEGGRHERRVNKIAIPNN